MRFWRGNPAEIELLFKELLIGVTNFFRDAKVWEYLMETALPQLLAAHPDGAAFKAWVPACSTGEEAYSLAIAFSEVLEQQRPTARYTLQIFATDLDDDAIDRARQGVFDAGIEDDVTPGQCCSATSCRRKKAATASARTCATPSSSRARTSFPIRRSPSSISCAAATC